VPRQSHSALVRRLEKVGRLRSERLSTRDVTATVARVESSRAAAVATRLRLENLKRIAQDVPDNLALEREMQRATDEVASADAKLRQLERQATLTRVVVQLIAAEPEEIAPAQLPFPWLQGLGLEELYDPSGAPQRRGLELRAIEDFSAQLRAGYLAEGEATGSAKLSFTGALSVRVLGEANPVGLFGGIDLALGASKGLVYGAQPLLGAGVPLGRRLVIGLSSGPGIDGITSVIPFGVDVPLELFVSIDAAEWMAASAWVQDTWVLASERRQDGSPHAPFGDELSAGLTLSMGPRDSFGSYSQRRKTLLFGFAYRETMGTALYELRFGWGFLGADFSG